MNGSVYSKDDAHEIAGRNCFAVLVDDEPGVLARVVGLFSGRGYNIESLTVDVVDPEQQLSRITIVTTGTPMVIEQIKAQLARLVPVRQVVNLTKQGSFIEGSLAYIKFVGNADAREDAKMIARKLGARIVDTSSNAVIFELTATINKIDQMIAELKPLGAVEIARTGGVAMACGEAMLSVAPRPSDLKSA